MKNIFCLVLLVAFTTVKAQTDVSCNVKTASDARKCMKEVALSIPRANLPNDAVASDRTDLLVTVLNGLGVDEATVTEVENADFVGAVVYHESEHRIFYYTITSGRSTPKMVFDFNVVDLPSDLVEPLKRDSPLAKHVTYMLGVNKRGLDIYEILQEKIDEALEQGEE
jgi:hypothetical protein